MTVKELKEILDQLPDDADLYRPPARDDGDNILIDCVDATFIADTVNILLT